MLPTDSASGVDDDAAAQRRRRAGVAASSIKQQSDPTPAAEDVPASVYSRLERSVVAWLWLCDNTLYTFAGLGKKSVRMPCLLMENLVFPISLSLCMLYAFGTLDSSAVRKRAIVIWVSYMLYQAILTMVIVHVNDFPLARGVMLFFFHLFFAAAFGWLMGVLRDELRAIGSIDATRVKRLFEIMGLQLALVVIGATQGIKKGDLPRIAATSTFSMSLLFAWLFSVAIFDVTGLDAYAAATRMELRPIEGFAVFFTGTLTLAGLASWVLSEQNKPSRKMVVAVFDVFFVSLLGAYFCTARIVWVARRKRRSKVGDDDLPA